MEADEFAFCSTLGEFHEKKTAVRVKLIRVSPVELQMRKDECNQDFRCGISSCFAFAFLTRES